MRGQRSQRREHSEEGKRCVLRTGRIKRSSITSASAHTLGQTPAGTYYTSKLYMEGGM